MPFTKTDFPRGAFTSEKPNIVIGIDKNQSKCDFADGNTVNRSRQPVFLCLTIDKTADQKGIKRPRKKLYKKANLF